MKLIILLIFIGIPLAEIAVFIWVGDIIGIGATVALVILTAIIGVALLKRQGLAALERAQRTIDAGELPVDSVIDGVCLLVAGAFLLTPGLITDTAGFLLLLPALRHGLGRWVMTKVKESGSVKVWTTGPPPRGSGAPGPGTIEGEYEDVTPEKEKDEDRPSIERSDPRSPWRK